MNKLMFSISAAVVGSLLAAGTATADFSHLVMEEVDNGGMVAGTTYDLYAYMDAGGRVDAVYGDGVNTLSIAVDGGSFIQNGYGGNTSLNINPALVLVFPSLAYDSFVTIGMLDNPSSEPFNALVVVGELDWAGFAGSELSTTNGTWFVTPDDAQGDADIDNRVLLGRFSIDGGTLVGQISLQGRDSSATVWRAEGVTWVPAPGALALLGLAGLATRRRRK